MMIFRMVKGDSQFQLSEIIKRTYSYKIKIFKNRCLQPLITIILALYFSHAIADDSLSESINHAKQHADMSEIGIGIGALVFIGSDFRIFYRNSDSPWAFGIRHLDIKDDFINETAVGLPSNDSDKEYTERFGLYFDYLFNKSLDLGSYYLSGAIYNTSIKITCNSESDSDSATGLYFGGGYQGSYGNNFGYNIGLLISPFVSLEQNTSTCNSTSSGDIDVNLSLIFKF